MRTVTMIHHLASSCCNRLHVCLELVLLMHTQTDIDWLWLIRTMPLHAVLLEGSLTS
jgi:hypothetical protein